MRYKPSRYISAGRFLYPAAVFMLLLAPLSVRSQSQSSPSPVQEFRKGEVIVEIKPGASIEAINARYGTTVIKRLFGTNFYLLATNKGKKENKWRKKLAKDASVLSASLNPLVTSPLSLFGR